jgi:hypothetical protein
MDSVEGNFAAVDGLSFEIREGESLGLAAAFILAAAVWRVRGRRMVYLAP